MEIDKRKGRRRKREGSQSESSRKEENQGPDLAVEDSRKERDDATDERLRRERLHSYSC